MKNIILACLSGLLLSACATVARGPNVDMVVATEPLGARVITDLETKRSRKARKKNYSLDPVYYGCVSTPCEFEMPRRSIFILTIEKEGFEPVEIGVDYSMHKESLDANLMGSAGTGVAAGAMTGSIVAAWGGAGVGTAAVASALTVAAGIGVVSIGVDSATGAIQNLNPNPIFIVLPPEGTEFEPDPKVEAIKKYRLGIPIKDGNWSGPVFPKDKS